MGCPGGCGGKKAQAASSTEPRDVKMPDGKVVTVTSARQEQVERDLAHQRMREAARKAKASKGYSVTR